MKITIGLDLFTMALSPLAKIVDKHTHNPLLYCVKIQAVKDEIYLTTSNVISTATKKIEGVIKEAGEICIDATALNSFLKAQPKGEFDVKLEVDKHGICKIKIGKAILKLPTSDAKKFPLGQKIEIASEFHVDGDEFNNALNKTLPAISKEGVRYALNAVLLDANESGLNIVCADGRRVAVAGVAIEKSEGKAQGLLITPQILTLAGEFAEASVISFGVSQKNLVKIKVDDLIITTQQLDGNYPNYKSLLSHNETPPCVFDISELIANVTLASMFDEGAVNIDVRAGVNEMIITSADDFESKVLAICPIEKGADYVFTKVKAKYFLDSVKCLRCELVNVKFESNKIIITARNYISVIMAMTRNS